MKYDLLTELKSNFDNCISIYSNEALTIQEGLQLKPGERFNKKKNGIYESFVKKGVFHKDINDVIFKYNGSHLVICTKSNKGYFIFSSLSNDDILLSSFFYTYTGCYYVSCSNISKKTTISYYESDSVEAFKKLSNKKLNPKNLDIEGIVPDRKIELDFCDDDIENFIKYSLSDDYLRVDDYFQELIDLEFKNNKILKKY